jgi:hypothetical protein
MERDITCRDTPRTFLFIHFNSTYFNFIPNNSISFQIYFSFQKNFSFMLLRLFQRNISGFVVIIYFVWRFFFDLFFLFKKHVFFLLIFFFSLFIIIIFLLLLFFCFFKSYFQLFFFKKIKFSFFRNSFSFFWCFFLNVFEFALECLDWLFFSGGGCCSFGFPLYVFIEFFEFFSESLSFFLVIIATFRSSPVRSSLYGLHCGLKLETSRESLNRK